MNKRILFCVETTRKANTEYPYILETIRHFYVESSKITIRPVYMGSKSRYRSRSVQEDIKKQSGLADTSVVYCVDTDDFDVSSEDRMQLEQIREYCSANGYDFVFFCRDVEDVFCGKRMSDTEKTQAIAKFRSSGGIARIRTDFLGKNRYQIHCSNILTVLDKYWIRKETGKE